MKLTTVTARIDPDLKAGAEAILNKIGVTHSQAINMLYSLIVLRKELPLDVKLKDDETTDILLNPNIMGQIAAGIKAFESDEGIELKEIVDETSSRISPSNVRRKRKTETAE